MSLLIKDHELLQKYNDIWEKIKDSLKREFDSKPVYNKIQYLNLKFITKKSTQILRIIKDQKQFQNTFAYNSFAQFCF